MDETSIFYQTKLFKYHYLTNISSHNYNTSKADPLQASYYIFHFTSYQSSCFTIDLKATKLSFSDHSPLESNKRPLVIILYCPLFFFGYSHFSPTKTEESRAMEIYKRVTLLLVFLTLSSVNTSSNPLIPMDGNNPTSYCLSWRLAIETNNVRAWRTVPLQCMRYVEAYMLAGQYDRDVQLIVEQVRVYLNEIVLPGDGMDAWILDIDDTCFSNVYYYRLKRYGYTFFFFFS